MQYFPVNLLKKVSCIYESVTGTAENPILPVRGKRSSASEIITIAEKQIPWIFVNSAKDINTNILAEGVEVTPIIPDIWPQTGKGEEKKRFKGRLERIFSQNRQ